MFEAIPTAHFSPFRTLGRFSDVPPGEFEPVVTFLRHEGETPFSFEAETYYMREMSDSTRSRLVRFAHAGRRYQSLGARVIALEAARRMTGADFQLLERAPDSPRLIPVDENEKRFPYVLETSLSHTEAGLAAAVSATDAALFCDIERHKPSMTPPHAKRLLRVVLDEPTIDRFGEWIVDATFEEFLSTFYAVWGTWECVVKANTRANAVLPDNIPEGSVEAIPVSQRTPLESDRFTLELDDEGCFLVDRLTKKRFRSHSVTVPATGNLPAHQVTAVMTGGAEIEAPGLFEAVLPVK